MTTSIRPIRKFAKTIMLLNRFRLCERYSVLLLLAFCMSGALPNRADGDDEELQRENLTALTEEFDALFSDGKYKEAIEPAEKLLGLHQEIDGPRHRDTADAVTRIGVLHFRMGDSAAAEPFYRRALAIYEQTLPPDDSMRLTSLNNLAAAYTRQEKYAEAIPLYEQALQFNQQYQGADHVDTATSLTKLADAHYGLQQYDIARPMYVRTLAIREAKLGVKHPDTATTLSDLGFVNKQLNDNTAAKPYFKRLVEYMVQKNGEVHADTAASLLQLALAHFRLREFADAEPLFARIVAIREKIDGPNDAKTAQALKNLAFTHSRQKNFAAALELEKRILQIRESIYGPTATEILGDLKNVAYLSKTSGNYQAAEELYRRSVRISEAAYGPEHATTLDRLMFLGVAHYEQNEYAEAKKIYQKVLSIQERVLSAEDPEIAIVINNLALICHRHDNDYARAEELHRRALQIREKSLGPDHALTAASLHNLAGLLEDQARLDESAELYARALQIKEKLSGDSNPDMAVTIKNLAILQKKRGDYPAAEALFQRALAIYERTLGKQHVDTITCLASLCVSLVEAGKESEAEPLTQQAFQVHREVFGDDSPRTAKFFDSLAKAYASVANYSKAESLHLQGLRIRETALGPDHELTAASLHNLAGVYAQVARYAEADDLFRRALRIQEAHYGAKHPSVAITLNNLALLLSAQGDFTEAESLLQRSLEILRATWGDNHDEVAKCLSNIALIKGDLGDHQAAVELHRQALKIEEQIFGLRHKDTANTLNNLGLALKDSRDLSAAEKNLRQALEIRETILGAKHPSTAVTLNNLGTLLEAQHRNAEAEPFLSRALSIREDVLGPTHPDTAQSINNLAFLHFQQREFSRSETLFRKSLQIRLDSVGPNHPDTIANLNSLAWTQIASGTQNDALALLDRSRRSTRTHVAKILSALPEKQQQQYLNDRYHTDFHIALSFALRNSGKPQIVQQSAAWLMNGKAVAMEALAQRNLLTRNAQDPNIGSKVTELRQVRQQLAALAMSTALGKQRYKKRDAMKKLEAREAQLSRELGDVPNEGNQASGEWTELRDVRQAMPQNSVFIDIARFEAFQFSTGPAATQWGDSHYVACLTYATSGRDSVLIDLGSASEIDSLVQAVRDELQACPGEEGSIQTQGPEAATETLKQKLRVLADSIWQPLMPHLGDATRVILSPDGALWLVPWSALPLQDAEDSFLIEHFEVSLVVSGRDLVKPKSDRPSQPGVIFTNPLFDQQVDEKASAIRAIFKEIPPADDTSSPGIADKSALPNVDSLPYTEVEAYAIQPGIEELTGRAPSLYKQRYALERVAKALHGPQIATFATHGFFLPRQRVPRIDFTRWEIDGPARRRPSDGVQYLENPLLRCGLMLAGCNNGGAVVGDDDGRLTGLEIVGIDFRGTELVVLSACQTGIGDVSDGEGVAGLRQAFQLAGAQSVVATLWEIPDRDSTQVMISFFQNLANKETKSAALRTAQLQVIEAHRRRYGAAHPFYWAAFTLTGQ